MVLGTSVFGFQGSTLGQVAGTGPNTTPNSTGTIQTAPGVRLRQGNIQQNSNLAGNSQRTPDQTSAQDDRLLLRQSNTAVGVVEPGVTPPAEVDPFAAPGIQIGTLRLNSFFKESLGYTANKQSTALGDGGAFSRSEIDLQLLSQWERHQLAINANGQYDRFFDDAIDPDTTVNIDGSLRLDLIDGFSATIGANYGFANESATSTSLIATAVNEPGVHSYGAFGELQRSDRRLELTLRGSVDRSIFEDALLSDGTTSSQGDRDLTTYGLSARAGYQSGSRFSPFAQFDYARNVHDITLDRNGENRDSDVYELRAGIAIDASEKLNGEISVGYTIQEFADPGLSALAGFVVEGNLNWSPQRDTTITFTTASDLVGSTTAGDNGAINYSSGIALTRRIRDDLEFTAGLGVSYTNFDGLNQTDIEYTARLGLEYWLNRTLSITGEADYELFDSTNTANSFDAATFTLGLRVQR